MRIFDQIDKKIKRDTKRCWRTKRLGCWNWTIYSYWDRNSIIWIGKASKITGKPKKKTEQIILEKIQDKQRMYNEKKSACQIKRTIWN